MPEPAETTVTLPERYDPTAQDVVDALRLALMAQDDDAEIARLARKMLEFAPEADNERGVQLLVELICEGSLQVALKGAEDG